MFKRLGMSVAVLVVIGGTAFAQTKIEAPETVGFSTERLKRLDAAMQAEIDAGRFAGINVMVARHGKVIKNGRYGYQNLETRAPLRDDAIFRIASMTKPVTGAALMILFEEGKWQLDDPLTKFLPELADLKVATPGGLVPLARPITMRDLVTSTAGFAAGYALNSTMPAMDEAYAKAGLNRTTLGDMIAKLAKLSLEDQPGTKFRYGIQHDLQGAVVERISGMTFDRFLAERLFRPLGMHDTGFGVPAAKRDRLAPLYAYDAQSRVVLASPQSTGDMPTFFSGGGGLFSTTADYMRFARMLANGGALDGVRVLAPSTVKLMMSDMLPEGVKMSFAAPLLGLGYGVDLGIVLDPGRASFNGGGIGKGSAFWTGSFGTWFWVDPTNDVVVVGMVQMQTAGAAHMGLPTQATDLRGLSRTLVYQALVDPAR